MEVCAVTARVTLAIVEAHVVAGNALPAAGSVPGHAGMVDVAWCGADIIAVGL